MKRGAFLHPLLFAALPVAILYAQHLRAIPFPLIIPPLLTVVTIATAAGWLINRFVRNPQASALLASPLVFLSLSYGQLYDIIKEETDGTRWNRPAIGGVTLGLAALFALYAFIVVRRLKPAATRALTRAYWAVGLFLLSFNAMEAFVAPGKQGAAFPEESVLTAGAGGPDIYYLILDQYAGFEEVKEVFGYDNGDFAAKLNGWGFFVAKDSKSRFDRTGLSLSVALNMGMPPQLSAGSPVGGQSLGMRAAASLGMEVSDDIRCTPLLRDNRVVRLLRSRGYRYVHIGTWFSPTSYNRHADLVRNCYGFRFDNEMAYLVAKSSVLRLLLANKALLRSGILDEFDEVARAADARGPKFVFAHIICPHPPYVFGSNGESAHSWETGVSRGKDAYLAQYIFVTKRMEELIPRLLERTRRQAVIVIQSDHGSKFDPAYSHHILNACFLPGRGKDYVYNGITPPNTFRAIFNCYLGGKFPRAKD